MNKAFAVAVGAIALLSCVNAGIITCTNPISLRANCGPYSFDLSNMKSSDGSTTFSVENDKYVFLMNLKSPGLVPSDVASQTGYSCDSGTSNIGSLQVRKDGGGCYALGSLNSMVWSYNNDSNALQVNLNGGDGSRQSLIVITCAQGTTTFAETSEFGTTYNFAMDSPFACTKGPAPGPSPSGGNKKKTDGGAIVLAIFFGGLAGYFVIGAIYLGASQGKRGVEIVPNLGFWQSLPGLIQDGMYFTMAKLKGTASRGNYSQI